MGLSWQPRTVEAVVWIVLAALSLYSVCRVTTVSNSSNSHVAMASASLTLLHLGVRLVGPCTRACKECDMSSPQADASGCFMSIALGPVLLQSMEGQAHYALTMALCSVVGASASGSSTRASMSHGGFLQVVCAVAVVAVAVFYTPSKSMDDDEQPGSWVPPQAMQAVGFFVTWCMLDATKSIVPSWSGRTFTLGEWWMATSGSALVVVECVSYLWAATTHSDGIIPSSDVGAVTAVVGVASCAVSCAVVPVMFKRWPSRRNSYGKPKEPLPHPLVILARLGVTMGLTLGLVEASFVLLWDNAHRPFPHCVWWIVHEFLLEPEPHPVWTTLSHWPRGVWLLYWMVVLLVTIPLAPHANIHPVIARKWFHVIALFLFVPTTVLVPHLMSLSYAVAVAVLLVLEGTRHDVPWLNAFYNVYLDSSKDESCDVTIVSHVALILGCALPLWIRLWMARPESATNDSTGVVPHLLPLWGVWAVGVGDAMAAMVGKRYGRIHWGTHHRTVEGSVALGVSLTLACWATSLVDNDATSWPVWMPAVALVTLLEAYTVQIDNVVLPLAGAAMLLIGTRIANG